jgi:hypothetical protein
LWSGFIRHENRHKVLVLLPESSRKVDSKNLGEWLTITFQVACKKVMAWLQSNDPDGTAPKRRNEIGENNGKASKDDTPGP